MQLVDRIEKRRFVGREFLLWLWFESEILEATLSTTEHGPFGLWLEKRLVLSAGKVSTKISAPSPGLGREAKEALLAGQLPESAGLRVAWNGDETSVTFKAEQMALSGLKLQTVLGKEESIQNTLVEDLKPKAKPKQRRGREAPDEIDESREAFYERMHMTQAFEGLIEALYRDFLDLRLSGSWDESVKPMLRTWAQGGNVDPERYARVKRPRKGGRSS
ncbi:MAG: hypothetical protein QM778_06705 [Myxococcales bacterium]